jgi:hypothetical protein
MLSARRIAATAIFALLAVCPSVEDVVKAGKLIAGRM